MKKYYPKYIEKEIYIRTLSVANSYYLDKQKLKEIKFNQKYCKKKNEEIKKHADLLNYRVQAVENTLELFSDEEQKAIKQNIIESTPMIYCNVNLSERSLVNLRKEFIQTLAKNLGELI